MEFVKKGDWEKLLDIARTETGEKGLLEQNEEEKEMQGIDESNEDYQFRPMNTVSAAENIAVFCVVFLVVFGDVGLLWCLDFGDSLLHLEQCKTHLMQ